MINFADKFNPKTIYQSLKHKELEFPPFFQTVQIK